jgi:hypothetical protein
LILGEIVGEKRIRGEQQRDRKTELKPTALWMAPHHTSARMEPPTALDSTQARPQLLAFHQDMPKFSARMR